MLLQGITATPSVTTDDRKRCEAVSKVIAHCPRQTLSSDEYFRAVGPQLLELLHCSDARVAGQYVRVAVSTITAMMQPNTIALTLKYVIQPLLNPLIQCTTYPGS